MNALSLSHQLVLFLEMIDISSTSSILKVFRVYETYVVSCIENRPNVVWYALALQHCEPSSFFFEALASSRV